MLSSHLSAGHTATRSGALSPEHSAQISDILALFQASEGSLLPVLHAVQDAIGYIPEPALPMIARAHQISNAEIWGVVTFYHEFRLRPAGQHVLRLCRAESCKAVGADALADHARQKLGLDWNATTPDGRLTLEPIFCLGLCACGPAALIDGKVVGRLDPARLDQLLEDL